MLSNEPKMNIVRCS